MSPLIGLWAALTSALGQAPAPTTCNLDVPAERPFAVPISADGVRVLLEVWIEDAETAWAMSVLDALAELSVPASVVIPPGPLGEGTEPVLRRVAEEPLLGLAFVLPTEAIPRTLTTKLGPLRAAMKPARQVAGTARTVIAPLGSKSAEAMLGRVGFRALMNVSAAASAGPRLAGHLEGQPRINIVFPPGPYEGVCGIDPRVGPFTPATADRAARAIQQATGTPGAPVVRVGLWGRVGRATDADVLSRWIRDILKPGGVVLSSAKEARLAALQAVRQGIDMTVATNGVGRVVSLTDAQAAAEALRNVEVIPRTLPGDLTPSEAFYAFALVATGRDDGDAVRIASLAGPSTPARSTLRGPTTLNATDITGTASAMLAAMPKEVPAAVPVGPHLLTASELLLALASVVRGDDPPLTAPVSVVDPNARGLGWGNATAP